jgi:hypothetical protein
MFHPLARNLLLLILFTCLSLGLGACTKGQGPNQEASGSLEVDTTVGVKPACGTPEFKNHPGCRLVNTSFYGHFRIGAVKLEGVVKSTYDSSGKLVKQVTHPEEGVSQTIMEVDFSYNAEGEKHVVTTKADSKPTPGADLVLDSILTETWEYLPDKRPTLVTMSLDNLPPSGPALETIRNYFYLSPTVWIFSQTSRWVGNPALLSSYSEYYTVNPDGYPVRISKDLYDPATTQKTLEDHTYIYENGKPVSSEGKVYYCPDQPAGSLPGAVATHCVAGGIDLVTGAILNDAAVPYGVQNITWKYDSKGRVSRMDVDMDGDMYAYDPVTKTGKMGPVGGDLELTWWCDFTYDDAWPEAVIAAYPKEFEIFGVGKSDKIKSIVCKDTKDVASVELHFDQWSYLHEVNADVAAPQ